MCVCVESGVCRHMHNVRECMSCPVINIIIEGSSMCHYSHVYMYLSSPSNHSFYGQIISYNNIIIIWDKPCMANLFLDEHGVALMMKMEPPLLISIIYNICVCSVLF